MENSSLFGPYRVHSASNGTPLELERDAMGVVTYEAEDTETGETVLLKVIHSASFDAATLERMAKHADRARIVQHLNIARVLHFGSYGDYYLYAEEYLEGETAASWVKQHGPMPIDIALRVALQIARALHAAAFHLNPHRAINPRNLILASGQMADGGWPFVRLINFGLADVQLAHRASGNLGRFEPDAPVLYCSPEQALDCEVDVRSDIYSLGCTLWFLLTGVPPFTGQTESVLSQQILGEPPARHLARFPKRMRLLLAHMLQRDAEARPLDPIALAQFIESYLARVERRQALARRFGMPFLSPSYVARVAEPRSGVAVPEPSPMIRVAEPVAVAADVEPTVVAAVAEPRTVTAIDEPHAVSAATEPPPNTIRRGWLSRASALAALLIILGALAVVVWPWQIVPRFAFRSAQRQKPIGVPIGIPQSSVQPTESDRVANPVPAVAPELADQAANTSQIPLSAGTGNGAVTSAVAGATPASVPARNDQLSANQEAPKQAEVAPAVPPLDTAAAPTVASSEPASPSNSSAENPDVQPVTPAEGPDEIAASEAAPVTTSQASSAVDGQETTSALAEVNADSAKENVSRTPAATKHRTKTPIAASKRKANHSRKKLHEVRRALPPDPEEMSPARSSRILRAKFVGTTSDGNWILRVGRSRTTMVVPPPPGNVSPNVLRRGVPIVLPAGFLAGGDL